MRPVRVRFSDGMCFSALLMQNGIGFLCPAHGSIPLGMPIWQARRCGPNAVVVVHMVVVVVPVAIHAERVVIIVGRTEPPPPGAQTFQPDPFMMKPRGLHP